jgi:hypothetical protein
MAVPYLGLVSDFADRHRASRPPTRPAPALLIDIVRQIETPPGSNARAWVQP